MVLRKYLRSEGAAVRAEVSLAHTSYFGVLVVSFALKESDIRKRNTADT